MKILIMVSALLMGGNAMGQDTLMAVYGSILDITTQRPIHPSEVIAYDADDSSHFVPVRGDREGRFMLGFFEERTYLIRFNAPGYAAKEVLVEMKGPTAEQWERGYGLSLDISLFREVDDLDLTLDGVPVGRGAYNPSLDVFEWDRAYSKSLRNRQKELMNAYKGMLDD